MPSLNTLLRLLGELATDLHARVSPQYDARYPTELRKRDRELEGVAAARELLKAPELQRAALLPETPTSEQLRLACKVWNPQFENLPPTAQEAVTMSLRASWRAIHLSLQASRS